MGFDLVSIPNTGRDRIDTLSNPNHKMITLSKVAVYTVEFSKVFLCRHSLKRALEQKVKHLSACDKSTFQRKGEALCLMRKFSRTPRYN